MMDLLYSMTRHGRFVPRLTTCMALACVLFGATVSIASQENSSSLDEVHAEQHQGELASLYNRLNSISPAAVESRVETLFRIAEKQILSGQVGKAVRALQTAVKELQLEQGKPQTQQHLEQERLRVLQTEAHTRLAVAHMHSGDYSASHAAYQSALLLARDNKDVRAQAYILENLGELYKRQRQFAEAAKSYSQAVEALSGIQVEPEALGVLQAKQFENRVRVSGPGSDAEVQRQGRKLWEQIAGLTHAKPKAELATRMAYATAEALGRDVKLDNKLVLSLAELLYQQLNHSELQDADLIQAGLYGALSSLYEQNGQWQQALTLANKGVFRAQLTDAREDMYRLQWLVARLNKRLGNIDQAMDSYRNAVADLNPIRFELQAAGISFMDEQTALYSELADVLFQKSNLVNAGERESLWLEARDVFEQQKVAEIQDYFKDRCVAELDAKTVSLEKAIGNDTAVIYPIVLADRLEVLLSYHDGVERYTTPVTAQQIASVSNELRAELEKLKTRDYLAAAQRLYQWLIAKAEPSLKRRAVQNLVVVADLYLRTIPFSVLHDGEKFLVEKFALSSTPSLSLTDPRPMPRKSMKVLLSGLSEAVQGFPALRHVKGELEGIQDLYLTKLLMNREFVRESIASELEASSYNVAHIASHSEFSGDVNNSYILTYDNRITVDQLGRLANINARRNQPIELLTLSACQTAAGDPRSALGLAGVAVRSGARSALATLWAINDKASSLLVTEFYKQLQDDSLTKAGALRQAQLALLKNIRYRHPGYWSPFLLIGNWM